MAIYAFGSGVLLGFRTDVAPSTPINFGYVQDVQIETSYTTKQLFGQNQFPLAIARGQAKVTGKAKMAQVSGLAFNNLFFGATLSPGLTDVAYGESQTVAAGAATVANSSSFGTDYGVVYASTGLPLYKATGAPSAGGTYSQSGGIYTFNTTDNTKGVLISYSYTGAAGEEFTVSNQLLGTTPTFQCVLHTVFQGKEVDVTLFNCVSNKLGFATKIEDFVIPELDFECFANAAGQVMTWSFSEAS